MTESIKEMVQKRLSDTWGWPLDDPEAVALAENVEFVANLLVVGTRTKPESLISALVHGPGWGQHKLIEDWDEAAKPDFQGFHDRAGFASRNWSRILDVLRKIA